MTCFEVVLSDAGGERGGGELSITIVHKWKQLHQDLINISIQGICVEEPVIYNILNCSKALVSHYRITSLLFQGGVCVKKGAHISKISWLSNPFRVNDAIALHLLLYLYYRSHSDIKPWNRRISGG